MHMWHVTFNITNTQSTSRPIVPTGGNRSFAAPRVQRQIFINYIDISRTVKRRNEFSSRTHDETNFNFIDIGT